MDASIRINSATPPLRQFKVSVIKDNRKYTFYELAQDWHECFIKLVTEFGHTRVASIRPVKKG